MYKCINCNWEGEEPVHKNHKFCPVCGDNTICTSEPKKTKKKKFNMDLNGDGKVDKKDVSLAARVMRNVRKPRKPRGKKR